MRQITLVVLQVDACLAGEQVRQSVEFDSLGGHWGGLTRLGDACGGASERFYHIILMLEIVCVLIGLWRVIEFCLGVARLWKQEKRQELDLL